MGGLTKRLPLGNNWRMWRHGRKNLWGFCAWATMASTLFGVFPQVSCRCPNGQVKLFCIRSVLGQSGCCDGSCCPNGANSTGSNPRVEPRKKCCLKVASAAQPRTLRNRVLSQDECEKGSPRGLTLDQAGCQKTLVSPQPRSQSRVETTDNFDHLSLTFLVVPPSEMTASRLARNAAQFWAHCAPPPTDLVTLLQHLTI